MAKLTRGVKSSVSRKYVKSFDGLFRGIGESDGKRVIAYFVSGMRTGSFFYLCLVLLSHVLSQHRLSRCKCPQHPSDLFDGVGQWGS